VEVVKFEHNGIKSSVYEVKDMLDSSDVVHRIQEVCCNIDLVLLCIKMPETRFTEGDENHVNIKLLEESLGPNIWKKTVYRWCSQIPMLFLSLKRN